MQELFQPYNNDLFNQFSGLLNGLMGTYIEGKLFENPLRELKKPAAQWGNTERHVAVKYLKAHSYRFDSETLLKVDGRQPEYVEWFYSVQKPRRYEFVWSKYELQRVFASDGYGFDDLLSATLSQMFSSDNYDEMQIMIQMFAEAESRMGLYKVGISAPPTDEATGKELLTAIRTAAGYMQFPTTRYNHIPVPVYETPRTLVLWVTPDVRAALDIQTLSSVFQLDLANPELLYRIITIPEFPIPNVYAALTSEDFIYARDVHYGIEPPFYNPENMTYAYFLHHSEMIGINPAANCALFGDFVSTSIPTISVTPSALTFTPDSGSVAPGGTLQTKLVFSGSVSNDSEGLIGVEPDAATYELAADRSGTAIPLNSKTYVDAYGVLHVQKTGLQTSDTITITATATYVDPSGITTSTFTDDFTATIL